jgi:hypothetical protein
MLQAHEVANTNVSNTIWETCKTYLFTFVPLWRCTTSDGSQTCFSGRLACRPIAPPGLKPPLGGGLSIATLCPENAKPHRGDLFEGC